MRQIRFLQYPDRPLSFLAAATAATCALLLPHAAGGQQLTIGNYHLQGSTRVSTTQYDYTYTADVSDTGAVGYTSATGTVTSSSPSTLVTQGSVSFGAIPGNGSATSTGTFTIRQDRRYAFSPSSLSWSFQGSYALQPGSVSSTNNAQVASYTVNLPAPGSVTVQFGPTTGYGRQTWTKSASAAGPVTILVAGMLPSATYHLQATVQFANGTTATDVDHTFATGAAPALPTFTVAPASNGLVPQPGVEQMSLISGPSRGVAVTDLNGGLLWMYRVPGTGSTAQSSIEGAKLMDNGDFIFTIGQGSQFPLGTTASVPNPLIAIIETDLAGNTVRQITNTQLSAKLQQAGWNLNLLQFHHDVTPLPNGHTLVLSNTFRTFTDLQGYPGQTKVLGDVVIDLDQNFNPVWVWDEFDHLDVNRHPFNFPDWTHTNAVVYSKDDGNILVSMRHQNWVVKVDYRNGAGTGSVLWHLGYQGDFLLKNGVDPTDWQYAQHFPSYFSANTAGVFSVGLMDNGNDRVFPPGVQCGTAGQPACQYTTIPVYQIDENAKTATLVFHQILPTSLYSFFGGNTEQLANGNVEYDLAGTSTTDSDVFEVTPTATAQTVWHLHSGGGLLYRSYRLPSLYPGVQWQQ